MKQPKAINKILSLIITLALSAQLLHVSAVDAGLEAEDFAPLDTAITELYSDESFTPGSGGRIIIKYADLSAADGIIGTLADELCGYRVSRLELTSFGTTKLAEERRASAIEKVSGFDANNLGIKVLSENPADNTQVISISKADDIDLAISILKSDDQVLFAQDYSEAEAASKYIPPTEDSIYEQEIELPDADALLEYNKKYSDLSDVEQELLFTECGLREDTMTDWENRGFAVSTSWKKALIMQILEISADDVIAMIVAFGGDDAAYEEAMRFDILCLENQSMSDGSLLPLLIQGSSSGQVFKAHVMSQFLEMPVEEIIVDNSEETASDGSLLSEISEEYSVNPELLVDYIDENYTDEEADEQNGASNEIDEIQSNSPDEINEIPITSSGGIEDVDTFQTVLPGEINSSGEIDFPENAFLFN
ncbi:MAG: hypothetical protein LBR74_06820, partial [Eubacterium sp.]|nr:hypothetical protein [Eubacterium sp.]